MTHLEEIGDEIQSAKTLDDLGTLEEKFGAMELDSVSRFLVTTLIKSHRKALTEAARAEQEAARAEQEAARADKEAALKKQEAARADKEAAQKNGTFFEDAKNMYELRPEKVTSLTSPTNTCFRTETPKFYQYIVDAANDGRAGGKLQQICTKSLGTNSEYKFVEGKDIFGKPIDPSRAHIFLDSKACAPAWGHMAEGATGIIQLRECDEKNKIRVLRMMGGKNKENACLRKDVHNFIPLHNDHRIFYDSHPQLMLIPNLSLDKIINWTDKEKYDVVVFVASPHESVKGHACTEIYKQILSHFPWEDFDEKKDTNICSESEIENAFKMLRHFIKALDSSLRMKIPQQLLDLVEVGSRDKSLNKYAGKKTHNSSGNKKKGGKGNKVPKSPSTQHSSPSVDKDGNGDLGRILVRKKEVLNEFLKKLEEKDELNLPKFKGMKGLRPVLKLGFGECGIPDPWLLMVKAAVNFSWVAYGFKYLPACLAPLDDAMLEYEEALMAYEQRERECNIIPTTLTIPVTPVVSAPPAIVTPSPTMTAPGGREEDTDLWETLSDQSL